MFTRLYHRLARKMTNIVMVGLLVAVAALALPMGVSAAVPSFDVTGVKADETVTVRTKDFPANTNFTVRMDEAGNTAIDGIVVAEINSGLGGAFELTVRIPAELRGKKTLAMRFDSASGYYTYNWFNNRSQGTIPTTGSTSPVQIPNTGSTSDKPYLNITAVKKNQAIMVEAFNLPVNTNFTVRVGPFSTFFKDYVQVMTVNSGSTGAIRFTVNLPEVVKDVETVTVRMDGGKRYAYNAFKNADRGTVATIPVTGGSSSNSTCEIVSVTPTTSMPKGAEFDAVWTVKNTSNKTWDLTAVDYGYLNSTRMHKYNDRYDMVQSVKPGETVKIIVDMIAPKDAGLYTTNWALYEGTKTLCTLPLTLRVR